MRTTLAPGHEPGDGADSTFGSLAVLFPAGSDPGAGDLDPRLCAAHLSMGSPVRAAVSVEKEHAYSTYIINLPAPEVADPERILGRFTRGALRGVRAVLRPSYRIPQCLPRLPRERGEAGAPRAIGV
jgi:hypothetical protein